MSVLLAASAMYSLEKHNHNYVVFIIESNTLVTSHNVTFKEENFPFRKLEHFDISHLSSDDDEPQPLSDPTTPVLPHIEEQDDNASDPGGVGVHQDDIDLDIQQLGLQDTNANTADDQPWEDHQDEGEGMAEEIAIDPPQ
ncbi:hypothetical protein CROQUDRAFT_95614 [Cronartium quercuum f. sp. fusiforme G11]|uniref:Uncharacterized protein n=1 Tax=Cronartium quercuum f. sp. fusiforme G11 TaxID=708437 RepID=A0A9P6NGZ4_9BASI|nr:hypothetical protein CROQUDRAFT_95614 [Cronartium quercuum f. sp. fusiforme G11]